MTAHSAIVEKLSRDELDITLKLATRAGIDMSSGTWGRSVNSSADPLNSTPDLLNQIETEFKAYEKIVSAAEARVVRREIRNSILRSLRQNLYSPFHPANSTSGQKSEAPSSAIPTPHVVPEAEWDRTAEQRRLIAEKRISWKDVDMLSKFIAPNGCILPRRVTRLGWHQQRMVDKAIKKARAMSLLPTTSGPAFNTVLPLVDPLQWLVDRLTEKCQRIDGVGECIVGHVVHARSDAMLKALQTRIAPELNYSKWKQFTKSIGGK